jgi:2-haloacid dehalogenase
VASVMSSDTVESAVFDFGGVIVDWSPRHLYRQVIDDDEKLDRFLSEVCTLEWHMQHDHGRPMAETIPALCRQHPEFETEIGVWRERYVDMIDGYIEGMLSLLDELRANGVRLFGLSNMPAEVIDELRVAYPELARLDGTVISGEERIMKPDPELYRRLMRRFDVIPERSVFVDDRADNVDAAASLGFRAVHFRSAAQLRTELADMGLPISTNGR